MLKMKELAAKATRIVGIDALVPGMTLAEAVFDEQGRLLVEAGRVISTSDHRRMRTWGIATFVVSNPVSPLPITVATTLVSSKAEFRDTTDPFMQELARFANSRRSLLATEPLESKS